jgi:glycosyltransferase involved in cell wall biosynthesis
MMNFPLSTAVATDTPLSLVKFLLPLDHDALTLPSALSVIDSVCHRGALAHEVVVVDDASTDSTAAEARRFAHFMPLWLIRHGRPLGRSAAFRTAVEAACRDASDDDLLVPIDPRRRPDAPAVLAGIAAAREGWSAVVSPVSRAPRRGEIETVPAQVAVYRAGLIKRHLHRFLETSPTADAEALQQLERYLLAKGVYFHRLATEAASTLVLHPMLGAVPAGYGVAGARH